MKRRSFIFLAIAVAIAAVVLFACRIAAVNEVYSHRETLFFNIGEDVPSSGESSAASDGAVLRVLDASCTSMGMFAEAYPEYAQIRQSVNYDSMVILVYVESNDLAGQGASLASLRIQSRSWANGVDLIAYEIINGDRLVSDDVAAPDKTVAVLPFMLDVPEGAAVDATSFALEGSFCLVSSVYPDKVVIDLGSLRFEEAFTGIDWEVV